jgi:hypothetical protein
MVSWSYRLALWDPDRRYAWIYSQLQSQIAVLSEEVMSSGELDDLTGLVHGALTEDSSHMERKRVLAALVAEIVIRLGKQVDITLNIPSRQTGEVVKSPKASQTPGTGVRMETTFVEVRGFEPRTPCMPSARDPEEGVAAQVIASSGGLAGMTPLTHAPATVIKIHGDYLSSGLRYTAEKLASYSDEQNALLSRIFDEYGLVVVGWSAEREGAPIDRR